MKIIKPPNRENAIYLHSEMVIEESLECPFCHRINFLPTTNHVYNCEEYWGIIKTLKAKHRIKKAFNNKIYIWQLGYLRMHCACGAEWESEAFVYDKDAFNNIIKERGKN